MRNLLVGLVLLLGVAAPQLAWAEAGPAAPSTAATAAGDPLRALFERLDLHLIARAHAAECKDEGEACKTNAECCSGLDCSGDPQPTCRQAE
jgi:hypothetical protein